MSLAVEPNQPRLLRPGSDEGGIRAMKYWCYYANVVRYLEKVEALFTPKTRGPAYLVWTDDDGPHMIAGPGIHWYRGDGPMPDLDALEIPVSITAPIRAPNAREGSVHTRSTPKKKLRAVRVSKRLPANPQSTSTKTKAKQVRSHRPPRQCRATTWRTALHTPQPPKKRRTKSVQLFRNPLKPAHSPRSRQGSAGQQHLPPDDLYSTAAVTLIAP